MEYKRLDNGFSIPALGLGTWLLGGGIEADYSKDEKNINAIKEAIKLGYLHIDTAESYGCGHTEELVGLAIKDFNRPDLFITTKVTDIHLRYNKLINSAKASLKRLQTDYIDLYFIHAPNPDIPIKETMEAMDYLVEQKIVKFIGVSNFTVEALKEAKEAQKHSDNKIVANQIEYNLLTRNKGRYGNNHSMESATIPYCQENDIIIIAERPLERGILLKPHPVMDKLAEKYNKTKAQIALNWLISKENIATTPMSTNVEHLKENLGAIGWNLSNEDMKLLDETNFERLIS
ncbi:MAG: aldo/keto reductase [Candidatus Aenigmarchaeota archaeon]|nr:aldo/keto reductase [Candidatus Aenigmarchaeota archaeon]